MEPSYSQLKGRFHLTSSHIDLALGPHRQDAIRDLSDRISRGSHWYQTAAFSPPLDLAQAVREVSTRDFIVLEVPER